MAESTQVEGGTPERKTRVARGSVEAAFQALATESGLRLAGNPKDVGGVRIMGADGTFAAVEIVNAQGDTKQLFPELGWQKAADAIRAFNAGREISKVLKAVGAKPTA